MTTIMLIFVTALFFGSVGTPLAKNLATKLGFIALPKADRAHTEPTALMGGLAIYVAFISALLIIILLSTFILGNPFKLQELLSILMGKLGAATDSGYGCVCGRSPGESKSGCQ